MQINLTLVIQILNILITLKVLQSLFWDVVLGILVRDKEQALAAQDSINNIVKKISHLEEIGEKELAGFSHEVQQVCSCIINDEEQPVAHEDVIPQPEENISVSVQQVTRKVVDHIIEEL